MDKTKEIKNLIESYYSAYCSSIEYSYDELKNTLHLYFYEHEIIITPWGDDIIIKEGEGGKSDIHAHRLGYSKELVIPLNLLSRLYKIIKRED